MRPIRKILVPTDFSPHAAEAFRQALGLARPLGASVVVLHVARPPAVVIDGGRLLTDPTRGESRDLWADLRKLKTDDPGVGIEHEVIVADQPDASQHPGHPGEDRVRPDRDGDPWPHGLKHRLFGGLTEEVVRQARCPVMVVKTLATTAAPTRVPEATAKPPGAEPGKPGSTPAPKESTR